jgi:hypothetical protein
MSETNRQPEVQTPLDEMETRLRVTHLEESLDVLRKLVVLCFALEFALVMVIGVQAWRNQRGFT